jgi:arsenate reductase
LTEVGFDILREFPKPGIGEFVLAADVVTTMSCGDTDPPSPPT